jgi:hypothetical protein
VTAALLAAITGVLLGDRPGEMLFAAGAVGLPFGLLVAGSPAQARRGWWLGLAGTLLSVTLTTAVIVRPEWAGRTLAAGWPAGALAALVGYWLLPVAILGAAAALALPGGEKGKDTREEDGEGDAPR